MIFSGTIQSRVHGAYLEFVNAPKSFLGPIQTDVCGIVGETPKGPVNTAFWVDSPADFQKKFGGMTPSAANPSLPLSGYPTFLGFALEGVRDKMFVRVVNSLASTSYLHISNGSGQMFALHAATAGDYSPGSWASSLSVAVAANANAALFDLTITDNATGQTDYLPNLAWANNSVLINTINANATLVIASQPVLDIPAAPTGTASTSSGTLGAGVYKFVAVICNAAGQATSVSPESAAVTLSGAGNIVVSVSSLNGGDHIKVYGTAPGGASGTEYFYAASSSTQTSVTISVPVAANGQQPPVFNGAVKGAGDQTAAPTVATTTFPTAAGSGKNVGADGQGATTAQYIGGSGSPSSGIYAFAGLDPLPSFVVLGGDAGADSTGWAAQATAAQDNGWIAVVTFPRTTDDVTAISTLNGQTSLLGSDTAQYLKFAWNWVSIEDDEFYNGPVDVTPAAFHAAISAVQPPHVSAASKPLKNILGTKFSLGSRSQVDSLIAANINAVTNFIPVKGIGLASDLHLSGDPGYLIRMKLLIAAGTQQLGGQFTDQPNRPPLWQAVHDTLMAYFDGLAEDDYISPNPAGATTSSTTASTPATPAAPSAKVKGTASPAGSQPSSGPTTETQPNYNVICDQSNNLFNGLPTTKLYADFWVRIDPNTDQLVFRAAIGTDVQVVSNVASS